MKHQLALDGHVSTKQLGWLHSSDTGINTGQGGDV